MHEPWLTSQDLAAIFQLADRRAASGLARRLGGVKIGGRWRVPPDAVDRMRIHARAQADHPSSSSLPTVLRSVPDPQVVPAQLGVDWWSASAPATRMGA